MIIADIYQNILAVHKIFSVLRCQALQSVVQQVLEQVNPSYKIITAMHNFQIKKKESEGETMVISKHCMFQCYSRKK